MNADIEALRKEIESAVLDTEEAIESFRLTYLSRKGRIPSLFKKIGDVPPEQRGAFGQSMNELKEQAQSIWEEAELALKSKTDDERSASEDLTLPVEPTLAGTLHPLTRTVNEMKEIFLRLGFDIAHGPEIEDDFHNFTALNFPPEHPARDMQDTFFVRKGEEEEDLVLRTHTSPVQVRLMQEGTLPIRSVMPGRVFRNEAVTAKSYFQFFQMEGLYVQEGVHMGELIQTLVQFARMMYGEDVRYRVRPSFFPFTEPSIEMDVWWEKDNGAGQWLEILGAGMVDPNVLTSAGLDPEKVSGYAFGMGVDRIAMLRYGIDDIRTLYENDLRLLRQFSG
ncbi:MAG: phenylalanine--tRNA ligase subunit alpha [Balneolaceae bacterium]